MTIERAANQSQAPLTLWLALLTTLLLLIAVALYASRLATPRLATETELRDLLEVVLQSHEFAGVPYPPPDIGATAPERPRRTLLLWSDRTLNCADQATAPELACRAADMLLEMPGKSGTAVPAELLQALPEAMLHSQKMPGFKASYVQLLSPGQIAESLEADSQWNGLWQDPWQSFYQHFPNSLGLVRTSNAVLSAQGDQAMLLLDYRCHAMCGNGLLFLFEQSGGRWRLVSKEILWWS